MTIFNFYWIFLNEKMKILSTIKSIFSRLRKSYHALFTFLSLILFTIIASAWKKCRNVDDDNDNAVGGNGDDEETVKLGIGDENMMRKLNFTIDEYRLEIRDKKN